MAFMLSPLLKRYTWNSAWLYYARIFIALCGTTAFPWWLGDVKLTIPLTLGMVAAALTDLDDRLAGRLRNLIITLFCFFIASASVELLFPWPWLFAIGLTLSTSGFILLGGLGQRYATIAFGALLIAIYTMLGTSLYEHWYQQPMYLLAGAVWYNVLTLIGHLLFPVRTLRKAKKSTPVITSSTSCPSSDGTNHSTGMPMAIPTSVPIILNFRRWRVAL